MSVFDEMKESLLSAGKEVSQKAKDASGIAKLKLDIKSKEDFVNKHYQELGKAFYEAHKEDEEKVTTEEFQVIREALEEIDRMREEILTIQGATDCPSCGAKMPEGATFCSNCGAKLNDIFEE